MTHEQILQEIALLPPEGQQQVERFVAQLLHSYGLPPLRVVSSDDQNGVLDSTGYGARLDELRKLKDGWLDGQGTAPVGAELDWFANQFERNFPNELPRPYLYPTAEGGVQVEWTIREHDLSLEVDLSSHRGEWHRVNLKTGDDRLRALDLDSLDDWKWLVLQLGQLVSEPT